MDGQAGAREEDAMTEVLERRFAAMGARMKVAGPARGTPRIDVRSDGRGEYFDIRFAGSGEPAGVEVVDVAPRDRHLLLLVRQGAEKSKFLCGHDERHWFVAAVPEVGGVSGVATAKAALQPASVRRVVARKRPNDAFRRRNSAYVRQGEWFFVPEPTFRVPESPFFGMSRSCGVAARRTGWSTRTGAAARRCM
jgi:hypothetical protein